MTVNASSNSYSVVKTTNEMRLLMLGIVYLILGFVFPANGKAQTTIKVHFLHGSKPAPAFKTEERKWLGGKLGGHVGIEFADDSILSFAPIGKVHWIAKRKHKTGRFSVLDSTQFWNVFGRSGGEMQKTIVQIPLGEAQIATMKQLRENYLATVPYDYAFLGIRCASSTDEILAKLGILKKRSYWGTIFSTFHPKVLRKRMVRLANEQGWRITTASGSSRRKWQR